MSTSRHQLPLATICLLLLLAASAGFAQKAGSPVSDKFSRYVHYSMEQGLSNNSVSAIAQDDDGFIWLGTEEGLNRFDGENFTPFFQQADGKGLPSDQITGLLALPGFRLLVATEKGLCLLHTRRLEFSRVALPGSEKAASTDHAIWKIYQAQNGQIWISASAGVYVLDNQLQPLYAFVRSAQPDASPGNNIVRDFLELPGGSVAVKFTRAASPYYSKWQVIDFQQQKCTDLSKIMPECGVLDSSVVAGNMANRAHHTLCYTTLGSAAPSQVYLFDWVTRKSQLLLHHEKGSEEERKRNLSTFPFFLSDNLLLIQRYFGAPYLYSLTDGATTDLPQWNSSWPDGKNHLNYLDRDGNLWLCPRFEGIYFFTLKDLPATPMAALNAKHKARMAMSGVSEEWFGFTGLEHAGKWVVSSGNGGLYSMDAANKGLKGAVADNPFDGYAYAREFAPDRGDTLWANTLAGLIWYNPVSNTQGSLYQVVSGLDSFDTRFIFRDRHGLIWGRVRNNGVCYFDTRSRKTVYFPSQGQNPPYPMASATACTEDAAGDMWFSFGSEEKYLVCWRRAKGVFEKIEPICPPGVACAKAFKLMADPHGNLWLNVEQRWYIMDIPSRQVRPFGKADGLITNMPAGNCIDRDGNVWFATSCGLSRYDPRSRKLRNFYQTDGLLSNRCSNVKLLDTASNILFVSTDRGMCLFEPDRVGTAAPAPPTFITRLRVSESAMYLPESGMVQLTSDQNDLRVEFTGVNFINGANNRYQYSLEPDGDAPQWKDAGTDNFANFLNLAPGHYTFQARTANSDGIWGDSVATLQIVIAPPWWNTWAFQLVLLFVLAAAFWWFYHRQINRAAAREAEKAKVRQQMADLEMRALRSQMNPHFVFNALNSVQNFILKNDTREASRYLTKFARLMRLILENSESPVVPLASEIELLRYYTEMESLRFSHRFSFDFQIDSTINPESMSIPGMLVQPHIENAIWHGLMHKEGAGHLWVRFKKVNDNTIVCEIEDNGVGRARAAEVEKDRPKSHRSTGLTNIRHRLELLNAQLANDIRLEFIDLYSENGQASGTKVVVRMPMMSNQAFTTPNN